MMDEYLIKELKRIIKSYSREIKAFVCTLSGVFFILLILPWMINAQTSADGWLGFGGSVITALTSFVVLGITRKDTRIIQKENRIQQENIERQHLAESVVTLAANYSAYISEYFYKLRAKQQVSRVQATAIFYELKIKLQGKDVQEYSQNLLKQLEKLQNCTASTAEDTIEGDGKPYTLDDFDKDIEKFVGFTQKFADVYLKGTNDIDNCEKRHEIV